MNKTEMMNRLAGIAKAVKAERDLPMSARTEIGERLMPRTTTVPPTADDYQALAYPDGDDLASHWNVEDYVKRCIEPGAIVHVYVHRRINGEWDLEAIGVGWIGTDEHEPMLLDIDGRAKMRTVEWTRPGTSTPRAAVKMPTAADVRHPRAMSADEILQVANEALQDYNLGHYKVRINERLTSSYGVCYCSRRLIEISGPLSRLNPREQTLDTILHEVAHAIAGHAAGHGPKWKAACELTGARPERCYSADVVRPRAALEVFCTGCGNVLGHVGRRHQSPKFHNKVFCKAYEGTAHPVSYRPRSWS